MVFLLLLALLASFSPASASNVPTSFNPADILKQPGYSAIEKIPSDHFFVVFRQCEPPSLIYAPPAGTQPLFEILTAKECVHFSSLKLPISVTSVWSAALWAQYVVPLYKNKTSIDYGKMTKLSKILKADTIFMSEMATSINTIFDNLPGSREEPLRTFFHNQKLQLNLRSSLRDWTFFSLSTPKQYSDEAILRLLRTAQQWDLPIWDLYETLTRKEPSKKWNAEKHPECLDPDSPITPRDVYFSLFPESLMSADESIVKVYSFDDWINGRLELKEPSEIGEEKTDINDIELSSPDESEAKGNLQPDEEKVAEEASGLSTIESSIPDKPADKDSQQSDEEKANVTSDAIEKSFDKEVAHVIVGAIEKPAIEEKADVDVDVKNLDKDQVESNSEIKENIQEHAENLENVGADTFSFDNTVSDQPETFENSFDTNLSVEPITAKDDYPSNLDLNLNIGDAPESTKPGRSLKRPRDEDIASVPYDSEGGEELPPKKIRVDDSVKSLQPKEAYPGSLSPKRSAIPPALRPAIVESQPLRVHSPIQQVSHIDYSASATLTLTPARLNLLNRVLPAAKADLNLGNIIIRTISNIGKPGTFSEEQVSLDYSSMPPKYFEIMNEVLKTVGNDLNFGKFLVRAVRAIVDPKATLQELSHTLTPKSLSTSSLRVDPPQGSVIVPPMTQAYIRREQIQTNSPRYQQSVLLMPPEQAIQHLRTDQL